jgi:hypothetical protein
MSIIYNFNLPKWLGSNQVHKEKEHAPYRSTDAKTVMDAAVRTSITLQALLSMNDRYEY